MNSGRKGKVPLERTRIRGLIVPSAVKDFHALREKSFYSTLGLFPIHRLLACCKLGSLGLSLISDVSCRKPEISATLTAEIFRLRDHTCLWIKQFSVTDIDMACDLPRIRIRPEGPVYHCVDGFQVI